MGAVLRSSKRLYTLTPVPVTLDVAWENQSWLREEPTPKGLIARSMHAFNAKLTVILATDT